MKKLDRAFIPNNRTFALFVIMLALLGCASYLAVQRIHSIFAQYDDEQSRSETMMAASIVNERINARLLQLQALAYVPKADKSGAATNEKLDRLRGRAAEMGYLRFTITNTSGHGVTTDGQTLETGLESQFQRASSSFATVSAIMTDKLKDADGNKNKIIVFEVPMYRGADIIGTLSATMKLSDAERLLSDIDIKYSGAGLFLIDSNSRVIVSSNIMPGALVKTGRGLFLFHYLDSILSVKEQNDIAHKLRGGLGGDVALYNTENGKQCLSFAALNAADGSWKLASVSSTSGIRASQMSMLLRFGAAFFAIVVLLLAILAYLYIVHWKYLRIIKFTRIFMDSTSVYPLTFTRSGDVRYCEDDFRGFLGLPTGGKYSLKDLMSGGQQIFPLVSVKTGDSFRISLKRPCDGEMRYLMIEILEVKGPEASALAFDVTGDEQMQEYLLSLAYKDRATGLPNSESFALKIEQMSSRCIEKPFSCACLFIYITDSNRIVEIFSEGAYRGVIAEAAGRLKALADEFSSQLYCLKRDEFALITENYTDVASPEYICDRIKKVFAIPFSAADSRFGVSCRTGIVICSEFERGEAVSAGDMFRYGEIALGKAKGTQEGTFILDDESYYAAARQIELEYDLSQALKRGEMSLYYQPIYNVEKDTITGAEALLRWESDRHGMVPPDVFIPMAEKNGYINRIGDFVIESALAAAARFQKMGVALEFNVSSVQLMQVGFEEDLVSRFRRSGVEHGRVGMELTESCLLNDTDNIRAKLLYIRKAGLNVLIDDFGSGYSSLSYLRDVPANYIKIDRSFVTGIEKSESLRAIVTSACCLGKASGMKVIVEGVETAQQLEIVVQCGGSLIQGYYIARPICETDFVKFVERFNKDKTQ
jgi:EAL domain-containing protein (putative c-di-GMP-specific phosphodiesterase class I)/GGDEF domain-containing protein